MSMATAAISLVCRVETMLCALRLDDVVETMRPLRVEPVVAAPPFVLGLAVVRGMALPVVDVACLMGLHDADIGRFVSVRVQQRRIALAVSSVLGLRDVSDDVQACPSLLGQVAAELIDAIGRLDSELLLVLRTAKLLPQEWPEVAA
jgi:purine-binding chemotaxis protein CheW